jgi:uncharacterized protein (TIGR04255 family)
VTGPDGNGAYLLDHDCYLQHGRRFDVDTILEAFEQLHILALGVFQSAITDRFYDELKGDD